MRKTSAGILQIAAYLCIGVIAASHSQAQDLKYGSEEFFVEIHGFFAHEYFDFQRDGKKDGIPTFDNHYLYLFVNPRIRENLWIETELEYEHGGLRIELDRAELFWRLAESATIYMGKFYAPFGIERERWYPSVNSLISRPMPSRDIAQANWYSVGVGVSGTIPLRLTSALNYDFAIINGLVGHSHGDLHTGSPSDVVNGENNADKAPVGRIGISPFRGLEFGASFYTGKYDEDELYRVTLFGGDVGWKFKDLSLRGEYIWSPVEMAQRDRDRSGLYIQAAYQLLKEHKYLNYLEFAVRYDTLDPDRDVVNNQDQHRFTLGLNISPYPHFLFKVNYEIATERAAPKVANNGIWIQSVVDF